MLHAREFCVCCLRSGDTDCSGTFSALMKYPENFITVTEIGLAVRFSIKLVGRDS